MALSFAILGLLNYEDMTGYDIKKAFDNSLGLFWTAQTSQIYRELGALEKQGFVHYTTVNQEDRPDKKVYHITVEGREAFLSWLKVYPKNEILREKLLLHIFFSGSLPPEDVKKEMQGYLVIQRSRLEAIENLFAMDTMNLDQEISDELKNEKRFWKFCALRGKYSYEANIKWAEDILSSLEQEEDL